MTSSDRAVTKLAGYVLVPSELEADYVDLFRERTPEERAEYKRQQAAKRARLDAFEVRLEAVTDPLARAVLGLHTRGEHGECMGDEVAGYEGEQPDWPCETTELVARHHGIEVP